MKTEKDLRIEEERKELEQYWVLYFLFEFDPTKQYQETNDFFDEMRQFIFDKSIKTPNPIDARELNIESIELEWRKMLELRLGL